MDPCFFCCHYSKIRHIYGQIDGVDSAISAIFCKVSGHTSGTHRMKSLLSIYDLMSGTVANIKTTCYVVDGISPVCKYHFFSILNLSVNCWCYRTTCSIFVKDTCTRTLKLFYLLVNTFYWHGRIVFEIYVKLQSLVRLRPTNIRSLFSVLPWCKLLMVHSYLECHKNNILTFINVFANISRLNI